MANNVNLCQLAASESLILAQLFLKQASQLSQKIQLNSHYLTKSKAYQQSFVSDLSLDRQEFGGKAAS